MLTALLSLALAASDFVGAAKCGACHPAALAPILKSLLPEKLAGHTVREKSGIFFDYATVPGGLAVTAKLRAKQSSAILEWAFGAGSQGITAVGRIRGRYFEHRVSWY